MGLRVRRRQLSREASLYHWRRQLCRPSCSVLRKLRKFSDSAGPRSRSEAQHVAILDRSDHSSATHSDGDGNSGGLCRRHGLFENNRHTKRGGSRHPPVCRCTVCHDRRRCSDPLVASSAPMRKRLCPHGAGGERPARLGGRSCSFSAGNKSSGLLLCRRHSLQLDQARFEQRRRRQHGHCFRTSISLVLLKPSIRCAGCRAEVPGPIRVATRVLRALKGAIRGALVQ